MKKEDFRIKEYDGLFTIEKRNFIPFIFRSIKSLDSKYEWKTYDCNVSYQSLLIDPKTRKGYTSLQDAVTRLEKILEKPKYHYL